MYTNFRLVASLDSVSLHKVALSDLRLPERCAFVSDPVSCVRIALEIAILVPVPLLQELQERVPQSRVHAYVLPRQVAADIVASQALSDAHSLSRPLFQT